MSVDNAEWARFKEFVEQNFRHVSNELQEQKQMLRELQEAQGIMDRDVDRLKQEQLRRDKLVHIITWFIIGNFSFIAGTIAYLSTRYH